MTIMTMKNMMTVMTIMTTITMMTMMMYNVQIVHGDRGCVIVTDEIDFWHPKFKYAM